MMTQRFFRPHERLAIYAAERGLCTICGTTLQPGFHGDHIAPACHGGPTDVTNAQGLCPRCNAVKGASTNSDVPTPPSTLPALPPLTKPLRAWQERGFVGWQHLRAEGRRDVLVTAPPGSGKSLFAARIMHEEITSGRADRIVIVVPSQVLKRQWAGVAQSVGLRLAASWGNDAVVLPPDTHGVIVTYAQNARLPEALRIHCSRHRVLVVFDEIHHGADGLSWGDGIREAFEHAQVRLSLSGTAWRGDAASIPFVTYDGDGNSIADVGYGYAEALADRIVREAYFFSQKGQVRWLDGQGEHEATFEDELHPGRMSRRLRAALDVNGDWLPTVMRQAANALEGVRQTHARAKGLVVCMDGSHARAVADMAARITGERPVVALSNDPEAAQSLATFRTGGARWLVVCRMAGEGFDCPDLRVCLWATNVMTELSFRQIVGRTIRMVPGLEYQDAQIFLPADRRLLAMARSILAERAQALGDHNRTERWGCWAAGQVAGAPYLWRCTQRQRRAPSSAAAR
jgi:superfamily II DNA or RNA helicase